MALRPLEVGIFAASPFVRDSPAVAFLTVVTAQLDSESEASVAAGMIGAGVADFVIVTLSMMTAGFVVVLQSGFVADFVHHADVVACLRCQIGL